jgi:hypothetical protein
VAVRLLSFLAFLLHIPLFGLIGRRTGMKFGWGAAALFSLFPIAVLYGSEGRGYTVASFWILATFERVLALRDRPSPSRAIAAGLLAAAAVLTHYLAVFPLLGIALAFSREIPRTRVALAGGISLAAAGPWIPIALAQPRASMAWIERESTSESISRVVTNALLGVDQAGPGSVLLTLAAFALLLLLVLAAFRGEPAAKVLVEGGATLVLAGLALPQLLLPERSAALFLSFTALSFASFSLRSRLVPAVVTGICVVCLALQLPSWVRRLPSEELAIHLEGVARKGARIAAVGLWGPELKYRLARAGVKGEVITFPSDVNLHPGWYSEIGIPNERLKSEARALLSSRNRPDLVVLPRGSRASAALAAELGTSQTLRIGETQFFEVFRISSGSPAGGVRP